MFTDMVGYTALGQRNESLSLALVEEQRKLIRPILSRHNGREVKTMGDAFLVEFLNALDAVRCAYDVQRATREFNIALPAEKRIHLRVGLHLGDVTESQGDISGDAVNVASRIEPLAEDGGVCVTRQVYDNVHGKFEVPLMSIGAKSLKNVSEPMDLYRMKMPWEQATRDQSLLPGTRLAVLPFANFSSDPNDAYFADGITDEIISAVSRIGGLSVISRTSVMEYKGTTKKVKEIGKELEVGSILEGSFRKAGNRIRVTTQLIDATSDKHLWEGSYDRELQDVFAVQSDIAKQVAEALRVTIPSSQLDRIERIPTESTTAYTLYLKGRYLWNRRTPNELGQAREFFEQAVREDPHFALGYVGIADCCLILRNNWGVDLDANFEKSRAMVEKALELDPGLAEAHATKGLLLEQQYDFPHAEEELKEAIELKPSYATAHQWYSNLLRERWLKWDEALVHMAKALDLDPLSPIINYGLGELYSARRDYNKAIEPYRRAAELGPAYAHWALAIAYGRVKMFEDMRREFAIQIKLLSDTVPFTSMYDDMMAALLEGDKRTVGRLLPELEMRFQETSVKAFEIAEFCFFLGENDKGFDWLERSYSMREVHLLEMRTSEELDGVRDDPRYLDLLKRL